MLLQIFKMRHFCNIHHLYFNLSKKVIHLDLELFCPETLRALCLNESAYYQKVNYYGNEK